MTIPEFLQAFAAKVRADGLYWRLTEQGEIRGHEPMDADPTYDLLICPVCFLAERSELHYWAAAPYLRMGYWDAHAIAAAADGHGTYDAEIRRALLAACKLTELADDAPMRCLGCDAAISWGERNTHVCVKPDDDIIDAADQEPD